MPTYVKLPSKFQMGLWGTFFKKIPTEVFKIQLYTPILRPKYNLFFFCCEKNILRMKEFRSFLNAHLLQYVLNTFLIKSALTIFLGLHINILNFFPVFNVFFCRSAATASGNFRQFELHILVGNILLYSHNHF